MALLRHMGIHQYGIGLWPALRAYRTFIRPVLEFGMAIAAVNQTQLQVLERAHNGCIKMCQNRSASRPSPWIAAMALADLPSARVRLRTLQLKFVVRLSSLPVTTLARCVELTFLRRVHPDKQWVSMAQTNPLHKEIKCLRLADMEEDRAVEAAINKGRDDELKQRKKDRKSVRVLRHYRLIDPILYLPAFSRDRHRLINWRRFWLPPYDNTPTSCRCGATEVERDHYETCSLVSVQLQELRDEFGVSLATDEDHHPIDIILNALPRNEAALRMGKWVKVWPALIRVLRAIDHACHPEDNTTSEEPPPEEVWSLDSMLLSQPPSS